MKNKNRHKIIIDNSSHQCFREVNLTKEFSETFSALDVDPCYTSPTSVKEYAEGNVLIGRDFSTEAWKELSDNSISETDGEEEAISMIQKVGNIWFMTSDIQAQNKCVKNGICFLDHVDFLFLMIKIRIVDLKRAREVFNIWKNGTNIPKKYPRNFTACSLKKDNEVKKKLGALKSN